MKDSSCNESPDELHPIVGNDRQGIGTAQTVSKNRVPAPHAFQLPEMLSYCLSADLSTILYASSNAEKILGCPIHQIRANGGLLLRHVHSDDRFRVLNALEQSLLLKEPVVVSYRWTSPHDVSKKNLSPSSVLVNHCVAAHSDFGEVITGVIFRITPDLNEELSLLFHRTSTIERTSKIHSIALGEDLYPMEDFSRIIPFLSEREERMWLEHLAKKLTGEENRESCSEHLFSGEEVYLVSLTRIQKNTFSPHYRFSLQEVTARYLKSEELKSLRKLKTGLSASRASLIDVEHRIEKLVEKYSNQKEIQEDLRSCYDLAALASERASHQLYSPFITGQELLLKSTEPLAAAIPSHIEMKLTLSSPELCIWRSIGEELLRHLTLLSKSICPIAEQAQQIAVTLQMTGSRHLKLELLLSLPRDQHGESQKHLYKMQQTQPPKSHALLREKITLREHGKDSELQVVIVAAGAVKRGMVPSEVSNQLKS